MIGSLATGDRRGKPLTIAIAAGRVPVRNGRTKQWTMLAVTMR
jgi:hypothetical protein